MGLFRPYERSETKRDKPTTLTPKAKAKDEVKASQPEPVETEERVGGKKGAPTPTRAQAQAARMEALHPTLSKREARKRARKASRAQSQDGWERLERSPERQLLRDFIDSRWTASEFVLPAMLVFLAATMATSAFPQVTIYVTFALWAYMLAIIINIAVLWRQFKVVLAQRYPSAPRRGMMMYLINRSMMIRRFRMPRPRISRGDKY